MRRFALPVYFALAASAAALFLIGDKIADAADFLDDWMLGG